MSVHLSPKLLAALLLLAAVFALRLLALNDFPLIDPSEGRYAEISREMAATGDWVVPQFEEGQPFWGKPPMYFWTAALSIKLFGATAAAVRLPSLIFSMGTIVLLLLLGRSYSGPGGGWAAAALLSSSALFFVLAGITLVDTSLAFFTTAALASVFFLDTASGKLARTALTICYIAAVAGSLLAKGLLALLVILPPVLLWALWKRSRKESFLCMVWLGGTLAAALLLAAPWHLLVEERSPGFLRYYLLGEHFARFFRPGWVSLYGRAHSEPYGIIWLFLLAGLLPWSLLLLPPLYRAFRKFASLSFSFRLRNTAVSLYRTAGELPRQSCFLLVWALATPLLFSVTKGVMLAYVLPVLPAWALLIASSNMRLFSSRKAAGLIFVIPLAFTIVSQLVMPLVGIRRSQALIAESMLILDTDKNARLIYLGEMPYSADFYADGRALNEKAVSREMLEQLMQDNKHDYFVVARSSMPHFGPIILQAGLELILETPKQLVYRESDSFDLGKEDFIDTLSLPYYLAMLAAV